MLPDLRLALAAIVATFAIVIAGFGVAATFRMAHKSLATIAPAGPAVEQTEPAARPVAARPPPETEPHPEKTASIRTQVAASSMPPVVARADDTAPIIIELPSAVARPASLPTPVEAAPADENEPVLPPSLAGRSRE